MTEQKLTARQKIILSNLKQALSALLGAPEKLEELAFVVRAVDDQPAQYTSTDDVMRLTVLKEAYLVGRRWNIGNIIPLLTAPNDKFLLWIDLKLLDAKIIELRISKRFRQFRELRNQEIGYAPFRIAETHI